MNNNLIIDGNAVYEIDPECLNKMEARRRREEERQLKLREREKRKEDAKNRPR